MRIWCFHGFRQTDEQFRGRTAALFKRLRAEFRRQNPPRELRVEFLRAPLELEDGSRAWWLNSGSKSAQEHLDFAMRRIREAEKISGEEQVLLGFSQGAAMVALVARNYTRELEQMGVGKLMLIGGFIPDSEKWKQVKIRIPSIHIAGDSDQIIPAQKSLELASCFEDPVILTHEDGHFIPSGKDMVQKYAEFLLKENPSNLPSQTRDLPQEDGPRLHTSLYRRPLPSPPAVPFSSSAGKLMFQESMIEGNMTSFFPLIEQFRTQDEPSYCGLSSLVMVLNTLALDPRRIWKGNWRWFSEEMLTCCEPLESIKKDGITFSKLACLAKCNGADVQEFRADAPEFTLERFRDSVIESCSKATSYIIVSYCRRAFQQTGDGHFSPIGGYHAQSDSVLILDVARFKYPPHWVSLSDLFEAMKAVDSTSKKPRGWLNLRSTYSSNMPVYFLLLNQRNDWIGLGNFIQEKLPKLLQKCAHCNPGNDSDSQIAQDSKKSIVECMTSELSSNLVNAISSYVMEYGLNFVPTELKETVDGIIQELRDTPLFLLVQATIQDLITRGDHPRLQSTMQSISMAPELLTMLILSIPEDYWIQMTNMFPCAKFAALVSLENYVANTRYLHKEIHALRIQMCALLELTSLSANCKR